MLKVNEELLREALSELNQCNNELYNRIEQINETRCEIRKNTVFEKESVKLSRILEKTEAIQENIKSMARVLDYAAFEYGRCEKNIASQCSFSPISERNGSRFKKVFFDVAFSSRIGWKKGD